MVHPRQPPPGKQVASPERTFLSSLMGRCAVQQGLRSLPRSGEERADGSLRVVYAASIRRCRPCPLREQCQWQGSATAKPRQVSVRLASACRWFGSAPLARLGPKRISARLYAARATPTHRSEPSTSCRRFVRHCKRDSVPHAASAFSSLLARAAGSQCSRFNNRASDDQTVRGPRQLCHLARFGLGESFLLTVVGFPLIGQACFSPCGAQ